MDVTLLYALATILVVVGIIVVLLAVLLSAGKSENAR